MKTDSDLSGLDRKPRGGTWLHYAALAAFCASLAIIWFRTGLVPAASGGDEVWWSESGYQFLHEGVLRWACLDDDKGSGTMSFWPPVAPLLQALMMKLFGVTAFGIYAQSSLICSLVMGLIYLLCRELDLSPCDSLFASCAVFGLLIVDRHITQVRMENLTALAAITFAWLTILASKASGKGRRFVLGTMAGFVLGIGLFCYYPQSPFLLLACGTAVLACAASVFSSFASVALGSLPILLGGLIWIVPRWEMFRKQVLETGASHFLSLYNLAGPFLQLLDLSNRQIWVEQVEKWGVLIFAAVVWKISQSARLKAIAAMAAISSLPMFLFPLSPQVSAGLLGVVLVYGLKSEIRSAWLIRVIGAAQWCLVAMAGLKLAMLGFTAYYQRAGRSYEPVSMAIREVVRPGSTVAISQRAWLGLRETIPASKLHFLVYSGASLENMPTAAKASNADDYFEYLVLEADKIGVLETTYPWIERGLRMGKYKQVGRISPRFDPLPWAKTPCYDLVIYGRFNN